MAISLKAKLYGESYRIHRLYFDREYTAHFQEAAIKLGEPLENALLNINFFNYLNIKEIQTIQDLKQSTFGGLINNEKSQVEVWLGRRKLMKLRLENLFYQQTLFPLYQTQFNRINDNLRSGLYLEEKEIGNIGIYESKVEKFEIDNLNFHLSEIGFTGIKYQLLNEISYETNSLQLIKSDTLLRYQRCFFKK